MIGGDALGRLAVGEEPFLGTTTVLNAAVGLFLLNGFGANIQISKSSDPMAIRRDAWDVDEWGKFFPGGGVRYTL